MCRSAQRLLLALLPLTLAACANPTGPVNEPARRVSPTGSATRADVIVDSPLCRSGYNVTQGRCE